ncbi:hypothetical protein SDC9_186526 [bioreactor metagenome]|uniref:Uncharacterized protein n=1 Tax=bioreactor metagenome TaxID=1076179 RepID=A0A645HJS2_9ZZZZ
MGRDGDLLRCVDEVKVAHQLADGGDHLRRQSARSAADHRRRRLLVQKPFAEFADRHILMFVIDPFADVVLDDARNLVLLIGHGGGVAQLRERHFGKDDLRGDPFLRVFRGDPGKFVARLLLVRFGHYLAQ